MPELRLSDIPKPASVQDSVSQLANRVDRVLLYNARRARKLEVDFAKDAEGAMMVAMCKLELCLRNKNAGGIGDIARIIKAPPDKGTVWFNVNGTDHDEFDDPGTAYDEPYTKFDQPFKPPVPIPSAGWTLLSNRDLVNKAILGWVSKNIIGTNLKIGQASLLMGGHYGLLMLAWSLGIGVFIYIASLLLGLGVPLFYLLTIAGGLGIVGVVYGLLEPLGCHREGDYDMTMMGLFPIIYRYGSLLTEESYDHVLHHLLGKHVSGGATNVHDIYHVCGKKVLPAQILPSLLGETENHILMIETSRFLTNQLLLKPNPHAVPQVTPTYNADFDNAKNGMREWMLKHLQQYLQNDFWEFNARPYARLIPVALQNLFEFSADPEVSKAARIVLDYLSAKFAVTSNGSRRAVPFRRLAGQRDKSALFHADGDEETLRFLILAGDTLTLGKAPPGGEPAVLVTESYTLVCAGLGPYRVPDLLLDLILMKGNNRYLQRIRHGAWAHGYGDPAMEISYNSAAYLITGGGLFADAKGDEQGWALPTTLMPTAPHERSTDWKDFIRIEGTIDETRRANTGVAPGFACGLNPFYPDWLRYPANPLHIDDSRANWTFINCASDVRPFALYVAVFRAKCDTWLSKKLAGSAGTFGFFAVVETENPAESLGSFTDFIEEVMSLNGSKTYTAEGVNNFLFPSGKGSDVDFVCLPTKDGAYRPRLWPIVKINGEAFGRDLDQWDLATSEVFTPSGVRTHLEDFIIRSEKHFGCVMIDNPAEDARLVLDLSDALHPRSAYVKENRFDAGCRCPLSNECERLHPLKSLL